MKFYGVVFQYGNKLRRLFDISDLICGQIGDKMCAKPEPVRFYAKCRSDVFRKRVPASDHAERFCVCGLQSEFKGDVYSVFFVKFARNLQICFGYTVGTRRNRQFDYIVCRAVVYNSFKIFRREICIRIILQIRDELFRLVSAAHIFSVYLQLFFDGRCSVKAFEARADFTAKTAAAAAACSVPVRARNGQIDGEFVYLFPVFFFQHCAVIVVNTHL